MAGFDIHVVVDWSAAGTPKRGRDSIWCAFAGVDRVPNPINVATRNEAATLLDDLITSHPGRRILIGFDFPFGFPTGTAATLGLTGVPWRATWDLLTELISDDRNVNNRFEVAAGLNNRLGVGPGPFWGCPVSRRQPGLEVTKPPLDGVLAEYRLCERTLRAAGHRPFSVWQLSYPGSVGGQALVGIPVLSSLMRAHPHRVEVWPFTTGLSRRPAGENPAAVVLAEVWPSRFVTSHAPGVVKDASQVSQAVAALAAADRTGELDAWLEPPIPVADRGLVEREEGWILGPGPDDRAVG